MKQFHPKIEVIHYDILKGSGARNDITKWLGESCVINTSKGIFEPFGTFQITFLDKNWPRPGGDFSLYAKVGPMDAIVIRAAHNGADEPKTIMRGFVTSVRRSEVMGDDGRPARRVTITGQDIGKLWTTLGLYFLPYPDDQMNVLSKLGPISKYVGDTQKGMTGNDFLGLMTFIMDTDLSGLIAKTDLSMALTPAGEGVGDVGANVIQAANDLTFYQFMASNLDVGALNELWMDDPGDGAVEVRWRPLFSGPTGLTIREDEIQALDCWRDDSRVSNWFWVWPRNAALVSNASSRAEALAVGHPPQDARQHFWCRKELFGFRKLEVESAMLPPGWVTHTDQPSVERYEAGKPGLTQWIAQQTQKLQDLNKDNTKLERCTAKLRGNEKLRPGQWHKIRKGDTTFKYYAVKVEHQVELYGGFFTTLHGERGEVWSGDTTYIPELNLSGAIE